MTARRVIPIALLGSAAVWPEWARFRMTTPSLEDDWFGVTYSGQALHALLHGHYGASGLDFAGRYRPSYTAIWNYAQWNLFGRHSMATVAAWGVVRAALFLLAVWILAAWLLDRRSPFGRPLVWLAPFAIALTPGIAVSLARYGPGDPMMITGLVLGLALLGSGVRTLLVDRPTGRVRARAVGVIIVGYLVYLIGVYAKESSLCVLVFVPFFVAWLRPVLRTYALQSRAVRSLLTALAVVVLAPLVHVAVHLGLAFAAGERPYPVAHTFGEKLLAGIVSPLLGAPGLMQTWLWTLAVPFSFAVVIETARRRDRDAWLLTGILVTGFLMSALSLARGEVATWYYIPWIVGVAVVAFRGLARTNLAQIAVGLLVVVVALSVTRTELASSARMERSGSAAIEMAKGAVAAGCPVYLANFDIEQRVAIPLLFGFARAKRIHSCTRGSSEAYAVSWKRAHSAPVPLGLASRCRSAWRKVTVDGGASMYACSSFRAGGIPDQIEASGTPRVTVVRLRPTKRAPRPEHIFQSPSSLRGEPTGV
ncbi:MAG: hypothetical protein WAQ33_09865 [Gaiellaceae bacterium]